MMQVQWRLDHALFNIQLNTRLIKHLSNYEPQLLNDRCAWFCTGIFFYIIIYQEHSEVAEHNKSKDFHC